MTEDRTADVLTIDQAGYLADLIRGVERGKTLRWYPNGAETDKPMKIVLRAFTDEHGNLYDFHGDIRDSHLWCSGIMEHWLKVRDVVKAMRNAIHGDCGQDQPMAVIDER